MSIKINTYAVKTGDRVVVVPSDGKPLLMTVNRVDPPMSAGRAISAGPMIHAWLRPGGYAVGFDTQTTAFDVVEHLPA